jgi:hypothetical protein
VVCQVDRLRRTLPPSIRKVLNDLPKTLDETYSRTLLGIDEEKREYAQRLFQCLMVSIRPLRVEELAEILAIQFDEEALPIFNTIGLQYTQKKRLCPYVRVSSPSLTGEAIKSYSSLTSPSRST